MDSSFDLPDSTDWLSTSLPTFEPLEAALRCEVCKEFYANPVITSCSHTFCSICIRRCIATDGKCPSCKTSCSSDKLAPNIAVREVVLRFQEARPKALELARAEKEQALESSDRKKRKLDETDIEEDENVRLTRSRRTRTPRYRDAGMENSPIEIMNSEDDGDEDFLPEGMAKCPICNKQMKAEQVYNHLDVCPGQHASRERGTRSKIKPVFPAALSKRPKESSPPPTRLSQLNYAMLKENSLRKKLQEIGIPNWGAKDLLKRRHIEWLNIYNSNCDADDNLRKSKKQLLRELEEWEQTQGGRADNKESKVMRKDFDGNSHAKSHKSNFDDLIAQARKAQATKPSKQTDEGGEASMTKAEVEPGIHKIMPDPNHGPMVRIPQLPKSEAQVDHQLRAVAESYNTEDPNHANDYGRVQEATQSDPNPNPSTIYPCDVASTHELRNHGPTTKESVLNPFQSDESGTRKVPMFALPEDPVRDMDSSTVVQ